MITEEQAVKAFEIMTDYFYWVGGKRIAEDTCERHNTFCRLLTGLGVDEKTAAADACEMEHAVSRESYEALKTLAMETLREECLRK